MKRAPYSTAYSSSWASASTSSGLVQHTWTIYAVSPLAYYSLRPTDLEPMLEDDLCFGGDYCHLRWFTLDKVGNSRSGNGNDGVDRPSNLGSSSKRNDDERGQPIVVGDSSSTGCRYRVLRTDHEILFGPYTNLHLFVDLYSNDERLLCSVGFCFVELSRGRIGSLGNFCMVRAAVGGSQQTAVETMWQWMESKTGCCISRAPIQPTSALIAASAAHWTVQTTTAEPVVCRKSRRTGNNSKASSKELVSLCSPTQPCAASGSATSPVRPLVLTWIPPPDCQGKGIDTCSTIVPPVGLVQMCHDLRALQCWRDGLPVDVGNGRSATGPAAGRNSRSTHVSDLLLATIVNFVSAELGMSLQRFSLSHATCTVAALGSDGRCKPTSDWHLLECLQTIRSVVRNLHGAELPRNHRHHLADGSLIEERKLPGRDG